MIYSHRCTNSGLENLLPAAVVAFSHFAFSLSRIKRETLLFLGQFKNRERMNDSWINVETIVINSTRTCRYLIRASHKALSRDVHSMASCQARHNPYYKYCCTSLFHPDRVPYRIGSARPVPHNYPPSATFCLQDRSALL